MPDLPDQTFDPADAPAGFTLEAEASRQDEAAAEGITVRDAEPDIDDDEIARMPAPGASGRADDDDDEDDPDDGGPIKDL
jgi:hypothetical protein